MWLTFWNDADHVQDVRYDAVCRPLEVSDQQSTLLVIGLSAGFGHWRTGLIHLSGWMS